MKLMTWNVNSVAARLGRLTALLERHRPDVLCLQELKCLEEAFPWEEVRRAGYSGAIVGQKTYNGVAVLTRHSFEPVARGFGDGVDDPQARFVAIRVGGMTVASAYVPNGQEVGGEKYYYKLNWLVRLRRWFERHCGPASPTVIAGDFNVAPRDLDVHDPAAWREALLCSQAERGALDGLCGAGLFDCYRERNAGSAGFTWWDYRGQSWPLDRGLRIDLILATQPVLAKVESCEVDRGEREGDKPSDHAPVLAAIRD